MVVSPRGTVRLAGKLPDGARIGASGGVPIDGEKKAPLFLVGGLRGGTLLSGIVQFEPVLDADATGTLSFRKGNTVRGCKAKGAHFVAGPSPLPAGSYPLRLLGAGVSESSIVTLSSRNSAIATRPVVAFILGGGINRPANGIFRVSFRESPRPGEPAAAVLSGSGVFLQKVGRGFGLFLKDGESGEVIVGP
jgi:hypothetical protein